MTAPYYTIGGVAEHFSRPGRVVHPWQVRRAIERGLLAEPPRLGAYRVFVADDLPRIERALREGGYLPKEVEAINER
jgi:hypothetical protein